MCFVIPSLYTRWEQTLYIAISLLLAGFEFSVSIFLWAQITSKYLTDYRKHADEFRWILKVTLSSTAMVSNGDLWASDVPWHGLTVRKRNNSLFHLNESKLKRGQEHLELEKICNEQSKIKVLFPSRGYTVETSLFWWLEQTQRVHVILAEGRKLCWKGRHRHVV